MRLPFAIGSYAHRSLPVSAQRVVNLFAERQPETAKAPLVLLPTPGLRQFASLGTAVTRGLHPMGIDLYAVIGSGVYRVTPSGASQLLGTIAAGGPVSMASDGNSLCIVVPDTGEGWVVDRALSTLTKITDADFEGATAVAVVDGYFVFSRPNSNEFCLSAIAAPLSFNALDFASAERSPDNLVAPWRVGGDLWLFGERTVEIWNNTGAAGFPFQRYPGGFIERGTAARFSICTRGGVAVWLGDDRVVYVAQGAQPQRISTHAIEQAIAGYARVDDAVAWICEQEGHAFYVLTFPNAGVTWVYDFASGFWHERSSDGLGYWRALLGTAYGGRVIAGDAVTGQLWLVEPETMTEGGAQIIRVATGTAFHAEGKPVFVSRLAAEFESGVGLVSGQGDDPTAWLSWSNDGGRTFGNDASVSLGRIGAYRARAEWRRLGKARDRVFRLQWADPVYTTLMSVSIDAEPGE